MLIDVRTPDEYMQKHHDDAVNIPLDNIETYAFNVPEDAELVLHCRSGVRARVAQSILRQRGFKNVALMNGTGAF